MNQQLIDAVKTQVAPDDDADWLQTCRDVVEHGAWGGFCGFTYYDDTVPFYTQNQELLVDLVEEMAEACDCDPIRLVAGFNCLRDDVTNRSEIGRTLYGGAERHDQTVANALAWFSLEEVARFVVESAEEDNAE